MAALPSPGISQEECCRQPLVLPDTVPSSHLYSLWSKLQGWTMSCLNGVRKSGVDRHGCAGSSPPDQASFLKSNEYYFYQASDGQWLFLTALDMRVLLAHHGAYSSLPGRLAAQVVNIDHVTQTEAVRKRTKFLGHLPLTGAADPNCVLLQTSAGQVYLFVLRYDVEVTDDRWWRTTLTLHSDGSLFDHEVCKLSVRMAPCSSQGRIPAIMSSPRL